MAAWADVREQITDKQQTNKRKKMPEQNLMMLILGAMLMSFGIVLAFISSRWAAAVTFVALVVCGYSGYAEIGGSTLLFWGIAAAICVMLDVLLPTAVARSRKGMYHIGGGSLAGAVAGMCVNTAAGIIVGAAFGAFFGAVAYSSTTSGKLMHFPSAKFFNYLAAKGLPLTVVMSMTGLVLLQLLPQQ